ncbi:hypothetical protein [Bacillus velezensis]|uniref:hypothetical protein n=1 Tax=Bacillus velezensis TaxID=492670 RepID=UPI00399B1322
MRLFPENPSGPGQRRRSAPVFLGDGSAGGEELQLKKRGQIRKTCRVARATWQSVGGAKLAEREVGRTASASLGGGNTSGEDLRLKERVCFRKTRRVQGNAGDRRPYSWAMAAPAAKNCS